MRIRRTGRVSAGHRPILDGIRLCESSTSSNGARTACGSARGAATPRSPRSSPRPVSCLASRPSIGVSTSWPTRGYRSALTSALTYGEQQPFLDAGFEVHERLHLLRHDLRDLPARRADPARAVRRGRRRDRAGALRVDGAAFSPFWRFDERGLDDARVRHAQRSRFRWSSDGGVVGYAITGRAGSIGYLQRLAVLPDQQREGIGHALVIDGLLWARRRGSTSVLVNTQETNEAAGAPLRAHGVRPRGLRPGGARTTPSRASRKPRDGPPRRRARTRGRRRAGPAGHRWARSVAAGPRPDAGATRRTTEPAARSPPARPERVGRPGRQLRPPAGGRRGPAGRAARATGLPLGRQPHRPSPTASTARTSAPRCGRYHRCSPSTPLPRASDGSIPLTLPGDHVNPPPLGIRRRRPGRVPGAGEPARRRRQRARSFRHPPGPPPTSDTAARPLAFSLVVPFAARPGFQPDGQARLPEADAARLGAAARGVAGQPRRFRSRSTPCPRRSTPSTTRARPARTLVSSLSAGAERAAGARRLVRSPRPRLVGGVSRSDGGRRAHAPSHHRQRHARRTARDSARPAHHSRRPK